ncbi:hypothetical protein L6452_18455 [Arctium lappa]|uniref:Uncharacterized protein n=1 Tax=Arctium lappa TaxID=4217 RepID=A0ACB9C683_ARCLA|nr:hypothetical protein L6452_18455 [Arctium lappa]
MIVVLYTCLLCALLSASGAIKPRKSLFQGFSFCTLYFVFGFASWGRKMKVVQLLSSSDFFSHFRLPHFRICRIRESLLRGLAAFQSTTWRYEVWLSVLALKVL